MGGFAILDASDSGERARWVELWNRWPGREVQAHPGYLELFASADERVRAATHESAAGAVLYPFIQRPLPSDLEGSNGAFDLTSPYGYGGAYAWGDSVADTAGELWPAFASWARDSHIVSEIVRLAVGTPDLLPYPGERIERLQNIIVPTATHPDELWPRYAHKVRKNVQKARRAGVAIEVDATGLRLDEFLRIYLATMTRREAAEAYRFSAAFFERLNSTLPGQFVYFHALVDGRVVSTELALISAHRIYSFLGGTDEAAFELRPNDLLKHEMIVWAHAHGKRQFVLGGGYRPDDGIYRYKESFAPGGNVPFYTGQRVFDDARYAALVVARQHNATRAGAQLVSGYFPGYRAPFAAAE